jgi:hypothetical protein
MMRHWLWLAAAAACSEIPDPGPVPCVETIDAFCARATSHCLRTWNDVPRCGPAHTFTSTCYRGGQEFDIDNGFDSGTFSFYDADGTLVAVFASTRVSLTCQGGPPLFTSPACSLPRNELPPCPDAGP